MQNFDPTNPSMDEAPPSRASAWLPVLIWAPLSISVALVCGIAASIVYHDGALNSPRTYVRNAPLSAALATDLSDLRLSGVVLARCEFLAPSPAGVTLASAHFRTSSGEQGDVAGTGDTPAWGLELFASGLHEVRARGLVNAGVARAQAEAAGRACMQAVQARRVASAGPRDPV